jgi:hypothetical protein
MLYLHNNENNEYAINCVGDFTSDNIPSEYAHILNECDDMRTSYISDAISVNLNFSLFFAYYHKAQYITTNKAGEIIANDYIAYSQSRGIYYDTLNDSELNEPQLTPAPHLPYELCEASGQYATCVFRHNITNNFTASELHANNTIACILTSDNHLIIYNIIKQ